MNLTMDALTFQLGERTRLSVCCPACGGDKLALSANAPQVVTCRCCGRGSLFPDKVLDLPSHWFRGMSDG